MAKHLMIGEDPTGNLKTIKVDSSGNIISSDSGSFEQIIDGRIRVTAHYGGPTINDANTTAASIESLAGLVGFNSQTDIKKRLNGGLKFILVNNNAQPNAGDLAVVTGFMQSALYGSTIIINYETLGSSAQINAGNFDSGLKTLCDHIMAYKAANPTWNAEVIIKLNHESNLTATYQWAAVNSVNLTAAGGVLDVAIANWALGFQRLSKVVKINSTVNESGEKILSPTLDVDGVPVYSNTVRPFIRVAHELAVANNTSYTFENLLKFNPGTKYYDVLSFNPYNRSYTASGDGEWRSFRAFTRFAFKRLAPLMAPGKDLMIGEMATVGSGRVVDTFSGSFTITNGGTGYPASQTLALVPDAAISCDGVKPVIRYTTNGSGVITSFTANYAGEENTVCTIDNFLGGSGLVVAVRCRNPNESKAIWWLRALQYIKEETSIKYVNGFLENKGNVTNANWTDYRDWNWNSSLTKKFVGIALNEINERTHKFQYPVLSNPNLCPDPFTSNVANFAVNGANAGTLSRVTTAAHLLTYTNRVTGVLSLTHNGTPGNPETNQVTFDITPVSSIALDQQCTAVVMAKFNPATLTDAYTQRASIRFGMYKDSDPTTFAKRLPPQIIDEVYPPIDDPYVFAVAGGFPTPATKWTAAIQVGQNSLAGTFYFTCLGFFIGDEYYPL
jgi:hypothetical protein